MKFCVIGDSTNKPGFSSHIIVSSLNNAAKKLGLFSEDGIKIKWDALCQTHGDKVDAFISSYEITFPEFIIRNSANKPLLGVSSDNYNFIVDGGKERNLVGWFPLGVDPMPVTPKLKDMGTFNVLVYTESLARGGIDLCLEAFGQAFQNNKNATLVIKDRNGTENFKKYVDSISQYYNIQVNYINDNWTRDQLLKCLESIDCNLYLNRSSTWALPPIELLSAGIPSIIIPYSGPKEYVIDNHNALCPKFKLKLVRSELDKLVRDGARNFFLDSGYPSDPVWAVADIESVAEKLLLLKQNKDLRIHLSQNALKVSEKFSWKNSVLELERQLKKWF